jgi:DNA (cytosine-5)-methyltransferase 1
VAAEVTPFNINRVETASSGNNKSAGTFIDLFSGCGGFTLGMIRSGFRCLAAIDIDPIAISTLRFNLVNRASDNDFPRVENALQRNLRTFGPSELEKIIRTNRVDVIVGGPPCQGFSLARRRDGANHGNDRVIRDARRHLYRRFLHYVEHFRPKVFVMENVLGIRSAVGGEYFTRVQKESRALGYRVHSQTEDAWELGVPQKRRRQLIIGVQIELNGYFPKDLLIPPRANPHTPLGIAIDDLPILRAGTGNNEVEYDIDRRNRHLSKYGKAGHDFLFGVLEINQADKLCNHVARPHSERDLRDFARLREGESSAKAMRDRKVRFEFPYDKSCFKDRYTRQSRKKACSTIVAHMSKDGLMFIHPTQTRSLTVREAARIQTFPDWFRFPVSRTPAYSLIGNAVPPLVSESVGLTIKEFLSNRVTSVTSICSHTKTYTRFNMPSNNQEAIEKLLRVANLSIRKLRSISISDFICSWHALLFLFPDIHPDGALDHGQKVQRVVAEMPQSPKFKKLVIRRYARSGWPIALRRFGSEAWRRFEAGEMSENDFYCIEAQRAGMEFERAINNDTQKVSAA